MGFLDSLKSAATSALDANQHGSLATAAAEVLQQQHGGVGGLVDKFNQAGLGQIASSWVSNGANMPVAPDQLQQVIGSDTVAKIAAKAGISPDMAKAGLAMILPMLVDKATPNGQVPAGGGSLTSGLGSLLSMFGNRKA